ncbi:hypothetical protein GLAREA_12223 [Glarea lozoyensis ATCC 20868]|uniref:Heterokaryon incompatibility domain-containing protein n=1 Tax=Glarea lozoyensis (strain ATCC 20868 / MF5171) TaxID=1116229 RepID=S3DJC2_GLAL2|nr:uncharacterized protein GLAREA_12223 [Glarea lozoyensis ATCC 20868]EPE32141.1 hypothetical protein GLAREA_12223 [Glarea lozoyensis ATCC 20868]
MLPILFQDAVLLTRAFGVEYLWIDALCIIQDDSSDWTMESTRMADVYSQAHLTISADAAKDASESIFSATYDSANKAVSIPCSGLSDGVSSHVHARETVLDVSHNFSVFYLEVQKDIGHGNFKANVLDKRAWAFQERLLSPRTLHHTANEKVFECRENWRCECTLEKYESKGRLFKIQQPIGNKDIFTRKEPRFDWQSIIEQFTSRKVTYDTDRLPAIAGVASSMKPYTPDDYLFGLWKSELFTNLLWSTFILGNGHSRRNNSQYAPTWSWASVTSLVSLGRQNAKRRYCEVLDTTVLRTTNSP